MKHAVRRIAPYTPDQLFALVADVERYPEFVPWITAMRVWNRRELGEGASSLDAEVTVGFSMLKERFATRVRRDATGHAVDVNLIHGPFKRLVNRWKFTPHPVGAEIDFTIDFEFKSRLLDALLRANFAKAVDKIMVQFDLRADELYGPPMAPKA